MKKTKILIADDHSVVRIGLSTLLGYQKDLTVVGEAENGEKTVAAARRLKPDVVVMDLVMPGLGGVEATQRIREALPDTKVLILTSFGSSEDAARAIAAGASGVIMKDSANRELIEAIRTVAEGVGVLIRNVEFLDCSFNARRFCNAKLADVGGIVYDAGDFSGGAVGLAIRTGERYGL